jgi:hypothetical protein
MAKYRFRSLHSSSDRRALGERLSIAPHWRELRIRSEKGPDVHYQRAAISGHPFDPRTRPCALGCQNDSQGRPTGRPRAERDVAFGNRAVSGPEAAAVARSGRMILNAAPASGGVVVAVAADRGHHFSKPPQRDIMLVEGHDVE